jgi:hypothetical protein
MKNSGSKNESQKKSSHGRVEIRPDLEDGLRGNLNEMPQMGGFEGVKGGSPPPKEKGNRKKNMADES